MLNAKTAALKNGVTDNPPTGLFANKRRRDGLCRRGRKHTDCVLPQPVSFRTVMQRMSLVPYVSGRCDKACGSSDEQVLAFAHKLPVLDWGKMHEVEITETDPLTGKSRSAWNGRRIEMDDGLWYFDKDLPDVFKAKFKTDRKNIKEIG